MQLTGKTVEEVFDDVKTAINGMLSIIPDNTNMYKNDEEAAGAGVGLNKPYYLHPDNDYGSIGGLTKLRLVTVLGFLFFSTFLSAQVLQRSGLPNFIPKTSEAHIWKDTFGVSGIIGKGGIYTTGVGNKWYGVGTLIQETSPPATWVVSGITSVLTTFDWLKLSTGVTYRWNGTAWANPNSYSVDSLLSSNNTWTGRNTFADSLTANLGIKSGGLIDTKGMKSTGSALKAANEANGVQKDAVIEMTASASLDGTFNTIVCDPSSADIVLTLPAVTSENNGWKYIISKKSTSAYNVRVTASGFNHVIISPQLPKIIKNKGGVWSVE